MIEAGRVFLPTEVDWLADFRTELLGFPNTRFDDQVDALAQLLIWIRERERFDDDRMVYAPRYGHKMLGRR